MTDTENVLRVRGLDVEFDTAEGVARVVRDVSLDVAAGQTLAILGESGSGKSMTAHAVMGLVEPPGRVTGGRVEFGGVDLSAAPDKVRRETRGTGMAMIFQDSLTALNPVFTVGGQIGELLTVHRGMSRRAARRRAVELMEQVQIPDPGRRAKAYPHQLSGGMRQRIAIAMAIANEPRLLIADEPTTALDVTVQAQIMTLLEQLQRDTGMALVLITHDVGIAAESADAVAVMYAGRIVETGAMADVLRAPSHPYTRGLMRSVPRIGAVAEDLWAIPGAPPAFLDDRAGCSFAPRCDAAVARCRVERPELTAPAQSGSRRSACHRAEEVLYARA